MHRVIIIGGGAAGMFAAFSAASNGKSVTLIEKNEKLGKKIYITGKGRCNLTANVPLDEFYKCIVSNPKFTYSSLNTLQPHEVMDFFESRGLQLKTERGDRVFPVSDKASDVTKTLEKTLVSLGVDIRLKTNAESLICKDGKICGVIANGNEIACDSVIVCCGGVSYPTTGSTGDGYKFAKQLGHNIILPRPSLVGIELKGADHLEMQGLSLKNVNLTVKSGEKIIYSDFGEMLFTHFGISGPIVLSASCMINRLNLDDLSILIDLKPALDIQTLDKRLQKEFKENNVKMLSTTMRQLLPQALINTVLRQARVSQNKNCSSITVTERNNIINALKRLTFSIKKLRPIEEAIVTAGGVSVKEINPKTMESKLIKGLFFAGEVIDIDAFTGGYNLQLAFSTGYSAGLYC